jgi:DNA-binding transcriptional MerR regulator
MIDNHFQIGEVAHEVGLSLRTIRYYEELGLVSPSGRSEGGFRLYTTDDVARLSLVKALKPLGMPLETMRELISSTVDLSGGPGRELTEAERRLDGLIADALDRCDRIDEQVTRARDLLLRMSAGSLEATG